MEAVLFPWVLFAVLVKIDKLAEIALVSQQMKPQTLKNLSLFDLY